MTFIRVLSTGRSQVIKDAAFCELLSNQLPADTIPINKLFLAFDKEIFKNNITVTKSALSNVHGDWYEWLIALAAWNYCAKHKKANFILLTPNVSKFDISRLYKDKLYDFIKDLREKVLKSSSVKLITSNPDFVIINRTLVDATIGEVNKITVFDENTIKKIASIFKEFSGKCDFEDIIGYVAVKTSFRPDRRLQIAHEGSLMKAIYTHLQTREWIIQPKGLKYYAMTTKVGTPDRIALKTVATHSITTVQSIPQTAVDELFEVNFLKDAQAAFSQILKP